MTANFLKPSAYLGNGIALAGTTSGGRIIRSNDFGLTWTDLGSISGATGIECIAYLGNGIAIFGTDNNHIWRSTDFGLTWTDLGVILTSAAQGNSATYLNNGIILISDANGHIFRSDVSFKNDGV
jgi:photosystem II stability/assembly factor-like uncharacterized protein